MFVNLFILRFLFSCLFLIFAWLINHFLQMLNGLFHRLFRCLIFLPFLHLLLQCSYIFSQFLILFLQSLHFLQLFSYFIHLFDCQSNCLIFLFLFLLLGLRLIIISCLFFCLFSVVLFLLFDWLSWLFRLASGIGGGYGLLLRLTHADVNLFILMIVLQMYRKCRWAVYIYYRIFNKFVMNQNQG